jgi:hypothetical protein
MAHPVVTVFREFEPIIARARALEAGGYQLLNASLPPFNWKLTFCRA